MINIEICINAPDVSTTKQAVSAAYLGDAATVELCADMHLDGLTPTQACMVTARQAFGARPGLMVMIRPRAGDFCYSPTEIDLMIAQIGWAAASGADGVVLGVLQPADNRIDLNAMANLMTAARAHGLEVTMHRAFDATPDPDAALDTVIDLGIDRILTSGVPWGVKGTALDGIERLTRTLRRAQDRIEVVLAGSISPANVGPLLAQLPLDVGRLSVHAYSGAQTAGQTTVEAVRALVAAAQHVALRSSALHA